MNKEKIIFFLRYGYFPNYSTKIDTPIPRKIELSTKGYNELQVEVGNIFDEVMIETLERTGANIVIPLSGGLDSRAILAAALKHLNSNEIRTYTFGLPGSYDYEIGKKVAQKANVEHIAVDLNSTSFDMPQLLDVARRCDYQTHLFHHPPLNKLDQIIDNSTVISGYVGDAVFGSYAHKSTIKAQDVSNWYLSEKFYTSKIVLSEDHLSLFSNYIKAPNHQNMMSPAEQMILYERGPKLTGPHILMKGHKYELPLINEKMMDFFFSLPQKYRINERLFIDSMLVYSPKLFNIPTKNTFGYHLKTPSAFHYFARLNNKIRDIFNRYGANLSYPPANYLDWNNAILDRKDLRTIFSNNINDLCERSIVNEIIDPLIIWEEHKKNRKSSDLLILLVSLEIIFKAKSKPEINL